MEWIEKVTNLHNDWVNIVRSFGSDSPEDVVQNMYLYLLENDKVNLDTTKGTVNDSFSSLPMKERILSNNGNPNKCYIWILLRSEHQKMIEKLETQTIGEGFLIKVEDNVEEREAKIRLSQKIDEVLNSLHWYDEMLFKLYIDGKETVHNRSGKGLTMRQIAGATGISLTSVNNTINNCRKIIEEELGEDLTDLLNKDYELIK